MEFSRTLDFMYIRAIVSSSTRSESESLVLHIVLRNGSEVSRSLVLQSKRSVKKLSAILGKSTT